MTLSAEGERMHISLDTAAEKLIADRVRSGKYASAEDVVVAALHALEHDERAGDFEPGELDALIEAGEKSGEALDGPTVLAELRALRRERTENGRK
jgi:antitoxin ParD1/3/4